ncbi:MAG: LPS export ABC transporter periplasmic protein LptC [Bacteroidales bacterium]|nr:LPS export ABC transporter periplasmic protein LptC [Bacteroidales bacterium]
MKKILIVTISVVLAVSCSRQGEPFFLDENTPHQTMRNATIMHTDSGRVQMVTWGEEIWNFDDEDQTQEFPRSVKATFYDVDGTITTIVTADEGTNWQGRQLMHLRGNVIIRDLRDYSRTYTESFFWDQEAGEVYSDVPFVRLFEDGSRQSGSSFRADEQMIYWQVTDSRWTHVLN